MFITKEIRWFFKNGNQSIANWFDKLHFDSLAKREDFYLQLNLQDVGVKLREGNIEVKHRIGTRAKGCSSQQAWGYFERWIKWSFDIRAGEVSASEISEIIDGQRNKWISVVKERNSAKLIEVQDEIMIKAPTEELESGCQIEYCKITIGGDIWYSFGLEWFGKTTIDPEPSMIADILGPLKLNPNQSMGYPAFLTKISSKKKECY